MLNELQLQPQQEKFNLDGLPDNITFKNPRFRPEIPSYNKAEKIKKFLEEWNTIEDIELYKPLYDLCSQLFYETINNKLSCLNYYSDVEKDGKKTYNVNYAEIKDSYELPLKKRFELHKNLLERVISNDITLDYCDYNLPIQIDNNSEDDEEINQQLSIFN